MTDDDLPALFKVADRTSLAGQREARRLVRWELRLLVLAAVLGVTSWRVGSASLDVLAGVGGAAFVIGTVLTVLHSANKPEERWYRGRAAAESIKSLAWLYAVGGNPFPVGDADSTNRLLDRLNELILTLKDLDLSTAGAVGGEQISKEMTATRKLRFQARQAVYLESRIRQQIDWYNEQSKAHATSAKRWAATVVIANISGAAFGAVRFLGWVDVDLLGVAAAVAGAATAWTQLQQHRTLAASYAVAVQDLGIVRERTGSVSSASWSGFVSDAEEAISREHTMWLARRGILAPAK